LLVLAMLRPGVQISQPDTRSAVFAVLVDPSRSMNTPDGPAGSTRHQAALKALADNRSLIEALGKDLQVESYEIGDKGLVPVKEWSAAAAGEQTPLGSSLDALLKETQGRRLVGVLLLSDGAQRAVAPYDLDPRLAAQHLAELPVPVYTVPIGSSSLTGSAMDLAAEDLQVSPTVFVKNQVIVRAKVRALGAAGRELTVRLLVEQPQKRDAKSKMEVQGLPQLIRPAGNEDLIPVELNYTPQEPGEYRIAVEVVPLDGELVTVNNTVSTFITVLKGGLNVAYFDVARPEQKWIRRITESPDIQLDFKEIRFGKRFQRQELEADWFQPGKYDVYIIGDVPAKIFEQPGLPIKPLQAIKQAVEQGAGLIMLGGFHSFGPGGYGETPLADVLPIEMSPTETQVGDAVDLSLQLQQPLQMLPTPQGINHFVMRLDAPAKNLERWKALAPLEGANKFGRIKPLGQVLAKTADGVPLLVAQDLGRGRAMAFAADTTYQWSLAGQGEAQQQFWRQVILWLSHKEMQGDSSIWVKLNERRFRPGQPIEVTFGARGPEGRPIETAEFKIEVTNPRDEKQQLSHQRAGAEHLAKFVDSQQPGVYTVRVEGREADKLLGVAEARFLVYEQDLELYHPAADYALLEEISNTTGGKSVPPEQLSALLNALLRQKLNPDVQQIRRVSLWDNWFVLMSFVTIMSVEWFFRKNRGLV
jgi:uncharacterized membrane protein